MTASRRAVLALPLIGAAAGTAHAALGDDGGALGIGLETWPYPAPVRFLPVTMVGPASRVAFVDIPPATAANGRAILPRRGKDRDGTDRSGPIGWLTA